MKKLYIAFVVVSSPLWAQCTWKDLGDGRLQLLDGGKPALVYNYGEQLPAGIPQDRARCCYIHPIYTPSGVRVTDDFPKDHHHHRGVFWSWPQVSVDGGPRLDSWALNGLAPRHEKFLDKTPARLVVQNGWYAGDLRIVKEMVTLDLEPAKGPQREFTITILLEALDKPVRLTGAPETGKGYGGLSVRFAPRQETTIRTAEASITKDEDLNPHAWAELEGSFNSRRAALRVTPDPANPAEPNPWCLRFYGFVGSSWPARTPTDLLPGKPVRLRYRILVSDR